MYRPQTLGIPIIALIFFTLLSASCEDSTSQGESSGARQDTGSADADGSDTSGDGTMQDEDSASSTPKDSDNGDDEGLYACNPGEPITLPAIVRDFSKNGTNPDFYVGGKAIGLELAVVEARIGEDNKPVFAAPPNPYHSTFSNADNFNQWYNTDPEGVFNIEFEKSIELVEQENGAWVYDSEAFFPLAIEEGFGDEGDLNRDNEPTNFRFTTEFHMQFTHEEGQLFTFRGDDDVWVFINGKLVIDIAGIHGPEPAEIDIDTLGLTPGESYPMDIFHAERNPSGSNFRIETNIKCFSPVVLE